MPTTIEVNTSGISTILSKSIKTPPITSLAYSTTSRVADTTESPLTHQPNNTPSAAAIRIGPLIPGIILPAHLPACHISLQFISCFPFSSHGCAVFVRLTDHRQEQNVADSFFLELIRQYSY